MQQLAASYLEYFEFDFSQDGAVSLAQDAPQELAALVLQLCESFGPQTLISVYEGLSVVAGSSLPHLAEVDEKVCPLAVYYILIDFLSAHGS